MKSVRDLILKETEGLPPETLNEILDFIEFLREKRKGRGTKQTNRDNLNVTLQTMNLSETTHLENEFKDYKELYPKDEEVCA